MSSSAQLEQEAEQTRSELARTLDELRERITPGQLVDEAVDYAKETTGGEFFRNMSRQMAANPLPVMLIGAGIGWLALAKGNSGAAGSRAASRFGRATDEAQVAAGEAARDAGEHLGEWSAQAGHAASAAADAYGRLADTAGRTGSAMAQSASGAGHRIAGFGTDALQFCRDQPLVLAGLGLALGAMIGAIMPPTDTEDRLMGNSSDRIKDQAREAAQEQMEKVKTAVEGGMDQAQTQAEHLADSVGEAAATSLVPEDEDANAKLPLE